MDGRKSISIALRVLMPLAMTAVVACAPSTGGMQTPRTTVDPVRIQGTNATYVLQLSSDGGEIKAVLEYPAKTVWQAVPVAYAEMSIPSEGIDAAHRHFVGAVSAARKFNGQPMSRFLDCGTTITGARADSYTIQFRFETQVDSVDAETANLRTRLEATGSSAGGASVQCASTGELERQIAVRVKMLLTGAAPNPI